MAYSPSPYLAHLNRHRQVQLQGTAFEGSILYKVSLETSDEMKRDMGEFHDNIMKMVETAGIVYSADGGNKDIFAVETDSFMVKVLNDYNRSKSFINFAAEK